MVTSKQEHTFSNIYELSISENVKDRAKAAKMINGLNRAALVMLLTLRNEYLDRPLSRVQLTGFENFILNSVL